MKLVNIKSDAVAIFRTIELLNEKFGASYVSRIVRADEAFPLRTVFHKELETYGALREKKYGEVEKLMAFLLAEGYLCVNDVQYGTLGLTNAARTEMSHDKAWLVDTYKMAISEAQKMQMNCLKALRKSSAETLKLPIFSLANDYTLQQIVAQKPQNVEVLKNIQGVNSQWIEQAGELILMVFDSVEEELAARHQRKLASEAYQSVKRLAEAGESLANIVEKRNIQADTVVNYLLDLHNAAQINLTTWIEANVNKADLHKASVFFQQAEDKRFATAHAVLGLEYAVLKLCKTYTFSKTAA
ncbi:MAG: RQC domain-containing protein [Ferruginibacter sp.]